MGGGLGIMYRDSNVLRTGLVSGPWFRRKRQVRRPQCRDIVSIVFIQRSIHGHARLDLLVQALGNLWAFTTESVTGVHFPILHSNRLSNIVLTALHPEMPPCPMSRSSGATMSAPKLNPASYPMWAIRSHRAKTTLHHQRKSGGPRRQRHCPRRRHRKRRRSADY